MTIATTDRINSLLNPPQPDPEDPNTWRIQPMEDVQRAAATAPEGPLVIIGGAGTGKSRVLENRTIHLAKAGASPTNIAVITFNARAALRLRGELSPALGADPANLGFFIGTMHKYCSVLLRQAGWRHVGINPAFTICDQEQSATLLEEVIARDAPDQPPRYSQTQLHNILRWFDLNRSLDDGDEVPPRKRSGTNTSNATRTRSGSSSWWTSPTCSSSPGRPWRTTATSGRPTPTSAPGT